MLDVGRVGVEAAGHADAAFEFDEGIQRGQIDRPAAGVGGRVFLDDFVAAGQVGQDEEIADGGGDVGLGLKVVMPGQNGRRRRLVSSVADIQMINHAAIVSPGQARAVPPSAAHDQGNVPGQSHFK